MRRLLGLMMAAFGLSFAVFAVPLSRSGLRIGGRLGKGMDSWNVKAFRIGGSVVALLGIALATGLVGGSTGMSATDPDSPVPPWLLVVIVALGFPVILFLLVRRGRQRGN
ncbi:hypothetical protein [Streptomyces sp. NPDC002104]